MDLHAHSLQSCLILCNPMDCSPPDSSVHGILQARILEWVAKVVILSKASQTEKEKYCMTPLLCGIQKEMIQMNLPTKQKQTQRLVNEIIVVVGGGKDVGKGQFGIDTYTLLYLKWISNKVLLNSTGNCSVLCGSLDGWGAWGEMDTCICLPETVTTL